MKQQIEWSVINDSGLSTAAFAQHGREQKKSNLKTKLDEIFQEKSLKTFN